MVAEVDERQVLTMLATTRDPATHTYRLADIAGPQFATEMRSHRGRARTRGA
jgi:hypothetical protein